MSLEGKPELPATLNFKYTIQIGAYQERVGAFRHAAALRGKGYDAYILELWGTKDPSQLWQSVRIGRFTDLTLARAAIKLYKKREKEDAYIAVSDSFAGPEESKSDTPAKTKTTVKTPAKRVKTENKTKTVPPYTAPTKPQQTAEPQQIKPLKEDSQLFDASDRPAPDPITQAALKKPAPIPQKREWIAPAVKTPQPPARRHSPRPPPADSAAAAMENDPEPEEGYPEPEEGYPAPPPPTQRDPSRSDSQPKPETPTALEAGEKLPPEEQFEGDAEALFRQADQTRKAGNRQRAETLLRAAVKKDPSHTRARRSLARLYVETSRPGLALEVLQHAVAGRSHETLAKEDPNLAAFLAALNQRQGEHWQAIELYETLLHHYPKKGIWRMGMAISQEKVGEPMDALKSYQQALASEELNDKLRRFVTKRVEELQ